MKFILFFLLSLPLVAEKEGHSGDPFVIDFHQRGQFILNEMLATMNVTPALSDKFASGLSELIVDATDEELPAVGRVLKDPKRPGKFFVLLDKKKYVTAIDRSKVFDLNNFVAHEIFETVEQDLSPDYPITKKLKFLEDAYQHWRNKYVYESPVTGNNGAFAYSFSTGTYGISWDFDTVSGAESAAYAKCSESDCHILSWVRRGCLAVARSKRTIKIVSAKWNDSRQSAEKSALKACEARGESCTSLDSVCTSFAQK